jgi:hypothetical protein
MWRKRFSVTVAVAASVIVLTAAACGSSTAPSAAELIAARSKWQRSGPASYTVTIRISCECTAEMAGPVVVTVRNGAVESRTYVPSGAAVTAQYVGTFPAVEGLFGLIEKAMHDGTKPLVALYHPLLGYPTRIELGDPAIDAPMYLVSDLQRQ